MTQTRKNTLKSARSIAQQSTELALAVPQVVAHRMTRMALSGLTPSARDRKEFQQMGDEKKVAFTESWNAMFEHSLQINQAIMTTMMGAFWAPWTLGSATLSAGTQLQNAPMNILSKGIEPVHKKATANARRLAKTKLY